jgi:hypothetical protein
VKIRVIASMKTGKIEEYTFYPDDGPIPPLVKPPEPDEPRDFVPPKAGPKKRKPRRKPS